MNYTWIQLTAQDGRMIDSWSQKAGDKAFAVTVFGAVVSQGQKLSAIMHHHNIDSRPLGKTVRSMSVGDIIVTEGGKQDAIQVHVVSRLGFTPLKGKMMHEMIVLAQRGTAANRLITLTEEYCKALSGEGQGVA